MVLLSGRQSVMGCVLIAIFAGCGCAEDQNERAPAAKAAPEAWGVEPRILRPGEKRTELRRFIRHSDLRFTTADIITFLPPADAFFLTVRTACWVEPRERFHSVWSGEVRGQIPLLALLPREVLFRNGRPTVENTLCEFSFHALSPHKDSNRFEIHATPLVGHEFESRLTPLNETEPQVLDREIGERLEYELRCENFNTAFTWDRPEALSRSDLNRLIGESPSHQDLIAINPRQSCRLFRLNQGITLSMTPVFELRFPGPQVNVAFETVTGRLHGPGTVVTQDLFVVHVQNRNRNRLFLRAPLRLADGLRVQAFMGGGQLRGLLSPAYELGFAVVPAVPLPWVRRGDHAYFELSPWQALRLRVSTAFRMDCAFPDHTLRLWATDKWENPALELVDRIPAPDDAAPRTEVAWNFPKPAPLLLPRTGLSPRVAPEQTYPFRCRFGSLVSELLLSGSP